MIRKLRAAALNDTSATDDTTGLPVLSIDEMWSLRASNDTVHATMSDALQLMEAGADESDEEVWAKLMSLSNITSTEENGSLRAPPGGLKARDVVVESRHDAPQENNPDVVEITAHGPTLLRRAFAAIRLRRATEARVQSSFEELIAAVRAEDPALAAEEAKKASALRRYESVRIRYLVRLLQHAANAGVEGAKEVAEREAALTAAQEEAEAAAMAAAEGADGEAEGGSAAAGAEEEEGGAAAAAGSTTEDGQEEAAASSQLKQPQPQQQADAAVPTTASAASVAAASMLMEDESDDFSGIELTPAAVTQWAEEVFSLRIKRSTRLNRKQATSREEAKEVAKHEHYARLLKLPRLVDETLSTWIDPAEDLSDKQIFHELLRMMGLVDTVEPRLMRAMIEAVKQHRLRREREEMEKGDWAIHGAESLSLARAGATRTRRRSRRRRQWSITVATAPSLRSSSRRYSTTLARMCG